MKPHHFVDILTALGAGQPVPAPHPYGHALHLVTRAVLDNPDIMLSITWGADAICAPCRHNVNGCCDDLIEAGVGPGVPASKGEFNLRLDRRWSQALGIRPGDQMTARELCRRIGEHLAEFAAVYPELTADSAAQKRAAFERGLRHFLQLPAPGR